MQRNSFFLISPPEKNKCFHFIPGIVAKEWDLHGIQNLNLILGHCAKCRNIGGEKWKKRIHVRAFRSIFVYRKHSTFSISYIEHLLEQTFGIGMVIILSHLIK